MGFADDIRPPSLGARPIASRRGPPLLRTLVPALLGCLAQLAGAELACDGVLGNSGGQGPDLVRGSVAPARGMGPVADRFGCLWDRVGKGTLVRCASDGRQLGSWRLPDQEGNNDRLAVAGDSLVLLLRGDLFTLAIDAAPGTAVSPLKQKADALAPDARDGKALVGDAQGLAWLDPASGARSPAGPGYKDLSDLAVAADGTLYAVAAWKIHRLRGGAEDAADGWPKAGPGEKPQLIDGAWYGHAWHSTIRRHDLQLAPAPGVVLGGNSGSFIGHVEESPDIINGRGLLHLADGGWAVGCLMGGICLLDWDAAKSQFAVVRRIGCLPRVTALGVDGRGRVTLGHGWWNWDDAPDAPQREGPGTADGGVFQLAPLGGGRFAAPAHQYGTQPRIAAGQADAWRYTASQEQGIAVDKDTTGVAAVPAKNGFRLIAVSAGGKAYGFDLDREGRFRAKHEQVVLTLAGPAVADWTSLAVDPAGHLLAAADGQVIVLTADGEGWKEERRWHAWGDGPAETFGKAVWIQADGGRLWVADRDRQRVLCFDLGSGRPLASFGVADQAGDDLAHLAAPQMIAAAGDRCVVHDAGNQRLVKLLLR